MRVYVRARVLYQYRNYLMRRGRLEATGGVGVDEERRVYEYWRKHLGDVLNTKQFWSERGWPLSWPTDANQPGTSTIQSAWNQAVLIVEGKRALVGNTAPAANADEWETRMLVALAEQDRRERIQRAIVAFTERWRRG
jgi:hypothetical protein